MDYLLETRRRLKRWGEYMRQRPDLPLELGYPSQAIGADAMAKPPVRTHAEQRERERLAAAARRPKRRTVTALDDDGAPQVRRETVRHMIPHAQPRDTGYRAGRTPTCEPWPPEVEQVARAMTRLPSVEHQVLEAKYVMQCSREEGRRRVQISDRLYRDTLLRAESSMRAVLDSHAA